MDRQETIADIIAERRAFEFITSGMRGFKKINKEYKDYTDRLDAAHKREVATTKESLAVGNNGDCAKLREACANIAEYARSAMCHATDTHVLGYLNQIEEWAQAALAEPVKNCEVGTVEQQAKRFEEYCESEVCKRNRCKSQAKALCIEHCALAWAQMPYVEKEGGNNAD